MQMQRADATAIDINGPSVLVDRFSPPYSIYGGLSWDWALNEIQKGLESGRVETKPNGGYVVNGMTPNDFFMDQAIHWLQSYDHNKVVRMQMYVAITIHAHLFSQHSDPGQRSLVIQGAGNTAVDVNGKVAVLEPGDLMFLNGDEPHRFTSLGPRFSITLSLEDE